MRNARGGDKLSGSPYMAAGFRFMDVYGTFYLKILYLYGIEINLIPVLWT